MFFINFLFIGLSVSIFLLNLFFVYIVSKSIGFFTELGITRIVVIPIFPFLNFYNLPQGVQLCSPIVQ